MNLKAVILGLSLGESKEKILEKINNISTVLEKTVDINRLIVLSESAPDIKFNSEKIMPFAKGVKIALLMMMFLTFIIRIILIIC